MRDNDVVYAELGEMKAQLGPTLPAEPQERLPEEGSSEQAPKKESNLPPVYKTLIKQNS